MFITEPDVVLCDLDGTLVFTFRSNFLAYQFALRAKGLELREEQFQSVWGTDSQHFLSELFPEESASVLSEVRQIKADVYSRFLFEAKLNVALVMILRGLKGVAKLGLVTTAKSANVGAVLEHFGLQDLFDCVVKGDDVINTKPAPDPYLLALNRLDADPLKAVAIEDSRTGQQSATAAGIACLRIGEDEF
jgi:beta-phosphoglucomutase